MSIDRYVVQLVEDLQSAIEMLADPEPSKTIDFEDLLSDEEEERSAPRRQLEDYTGIAKNQLPPEELLSDDQINMLLDSLTKLLNQCNWSFVLQTEVPNRVQYHAIRENFSQEIVLKRFNMGFFKLCEEGTIHTKCALGEYCQCKFYDEFFSGPEPIEITEDESIQQIEIQHLKRKYGDQWFRYYLYYFDREEEDEDEEEDDGTSELPF
jgi:hypothetical protein